MSKELDDIKTRLDNLESRQNESIGDRMIRQTEEELQSDPHSCFRSAMLNKLHYLQVQRSYERS